MSLMQKLQVVVWNVGFIDSSIDDLLKGSPYTIQWMKHNYKDRFFADPFIQRMDSKYIVVLAEEYFFSEQKGRIVRLIIDRSTKALKKREVVIDKKFHLSYPFIWKDMIIPEQSASGKWYAYSMDGANEKQLSGMGFIDGTMFFDGTNTWLFATRIVESKEDAVRKTYRYKVIDDKPLLDTEFLIKDGLSASRPGGNFFNIDGIWYRVAQTSTESIYGESIAICRVVENSEQRYKEDIVLNLNSHSEKRFNKGLHTLNLTEGVTIVDGFEMQIHPIRKMIGKVKRYVSK